VDFYKSQLEWYHGYIPVSFLWEEAVFYMHFEVFIEKIDERKKEDLLWIIKI